MDDFEDGSGDGSGDMEPTLAAVTTTIFSQSHDVVAMESAGALDCSRNPANYCSHVFFYCIA